MPETAERSARPGALGAGRALVMDARDNVVVAIRALAAGETLHLVAPDGTERVVTIVEPIEFGHKFASAEIMEGDQIIKYGERIGRATQRIRPGQHAHTHNITSQRGRGDLKERPTS